MLKRYMYRGKIKEGMEAAFEEALRELKQDAMVVVQENHLMTISMFRWGEHLFLYNECMKQKVSPEVILPQLHTCLEKWPDLEGARDWAPMMDIFHYHSPQSIEHWRRKKKVTRHFAKLIQVKEDMYSSYVFYHYQLQEERRQRSGNKYGIIGAHQNLLFFYQEEPVIQEEPSLYPGKLDTQNTPKDWGRAMNPHFMPWEDQNRDIGCWKEIERIYGADLMEENQR